MSLEEILNKIMPPIIILGILLLIYSRFKKYFDSAISYLYEKLSASSSNPIDRLRGSGNYELTFKYD